MTGLILENFIHIVVEMTCLINTRLTLVNVCVDLLVFTRIAGTS